jgi:hypothetical protein
MDEQAFKGKRFSATPEGGGQSLAHPGGPQPPHAAQFRPAPASEGAIYLPCPKND